MTAETKRELLKWVETIRKYPKGFEFTINYTETTIGQFNALQWIVREAMDQEIIECISTGISLEDCRGETGRPFSEETFKRL